MKKRPTQVPLPRERPNILKRGLRKVFAKGARDPSDPVKNLRPALISSGGAFLFIMGFGMSITLMMWLGTALVGAAFTYIIFSRMTRAARLWNLFIFCAGATVVAAISWTFELDLAASIPGLDLGTSISNRVDLASMLIAAGITFLVYIAASRTE